MFSGALIPDSILEFVSCSCNKFECSSNHCGCAVVNFLCTELCGCTNWKSNDSQEWVDLNKTFDGYDNFGEYQDKDISWEANGSSDNGENELLDNNEIEND